MGVNRWVGPGVLRRELVRAGKGWPVGMRSKQWWWFTWDADAQRDQVTVKGTVGAPEVEVTLSGGVEVLPCGVVAAKFWSTGSIVDDEAWAVDQENDGQLTVATELRLQGFVYAWLARFGWVRWSRSGDGDPVRWAAAGCHPCGCQVLAHETPEWVWDGDMGSGLVALKRALHAGLLVEEGQPDDAVEFLAGLLG